MKRRPLSTLIALGATWWCAGVWGQTTAAPIIPATTAGSSAPNARLAAVEQAEQRFTEAIRGDIPALQALLADDFIYLTTTEQSIGKNALLAHMGSGRTRVTHSQRSDVKQLERNEVVVTSGLLTVQAVVAGIERTIASRYLHVWVLAKTAPGSSQTLVSDPAGWQLLARQALELRATTH